VPWVYYITDRKSCPIPLLQNIKLAMEASVDYIQIREKDLSARELFHLAKEVRALAGGHQTKVVLNDRLDVALAANLNGVHLGQQSIPPDRIRSRFVRQDFIIGVSTHSFEELRQAQNQGADYATFGPVFFTPSKAIYGEPLGLNALKKITRSTRVPVLALGGIDKRNYKECLRNGASGIAAIRLFQNPADNLNEIVQEIKNFS
jgi:thiamine-phosphate pyrophosphorylase